MMGYMEQILGKNPIVNRLFKNKWKEGKITINRRKVEIDEE